MSQDLSYAWEMGMRGGGEAANQGGEWTLLSLGLEGFVLIMQQIFNTLSMILPTE